MKYIAELGRLEKLSLAELESRFTKVAPVATGVKFKLATFESARPPRLEKLGGTQKIGVKIEGGENGVLEFLSSLPEGKITLGVSDFRHGANARKSQGEALKLKKILQRRGRSVRVLENKAAVLSTATSHHNQLAEKKNHVEIMLTEAGAFNLIGVQNISEYVRRDRVRPARDAKVGMLPPKLAQMLLSLAGKLKQDARILDPFCGTGVVLQEARLQGFKAIGTDLSPRMIEYSERNLEWLTERLEERGVKIRGDEILLHDGDAMTANWLKLLKDAGQAEKIDAVVAEAFLGTPMTQIPTEMQLKEEKQVCSGILTKFLKNLDEQIAPKTPVVIAIPAWRRENGEFERLKILDEATELGYNVVKFNNLGQEDLLYYREGQIVAREIIVLRKK